MDLNTLYRAVIMDHYKNPKNKGLKKTDPYHLVHLTNPSCGDDMRVEVWIKDGSSKMSARKEKDVRFVFRRLR